MPSTAEQIQAELGATNPLSPRIIEDVSVDATYRDIYATDPMTGRSRWTTCTKAQTAAQQAAAIVAKLASYR